LWRSAPFQTTYKISGQPAFCWRMLARDFNKRVNATRSQAAHPTLRGPSVPQGEHVILGKRIAGL